MSSHEDAFTAKAFGSGTVVVTTAVGLHSLEDDDLNGGSGGEEGEEAVQEDATPSPVPEVAQSNQQQGVQSAPIALGRLIRSRLAGRG